MMSDERQPRSGWAVVQQMGHVTIAGYVTETTLAGYGVLSVAIPDSDRMVEKLIPPSTLYDLTWVGKEEALLVARRQPVQVIDEWTIRQEIRDRIETEEREGIEKRARRLLALDQRDAMIEDRRRVLDILSDAKAVARVVADGSPVDDMMATTAERLNAAIGAYCEERHVRLGADQPRTMTYAGGGYGDDRYGDDEDDEEPPI